ncbi:MAG: beta-galactosidase trimerization domain-containing protein, partial [Candidatus Hydrogenedentes bacterium]|nr:beta-galactosidase trimerization domain-containing protein [Candidatus Hydrogenedentota bacterium]
FHKSWGDFGGLRPFHSLLFDCYSSIANGGTCSVGDHLHPAGRLEPAVYGLIGEAYAQVQEYEQWTDGAVAEAEIAVIEPRLRNWPDHKLFLTAGEDALASVEGAARMLSELNCQFDVRDDGADLDRYRVVVLTDHVVVTDELKVALERHLKNGGGLLASSRAGLDPAGSRFALEGYAAEYIGPEPHDPSFFEALPPVDGDLPAMRTAIYQPGIEMAARNGAEVLARLHKPYVNVKTWDFEHEYLYTPPESDTGRPAAVRAGNIVHLSFPAFSAYHRDAVVAYRTLVGNCLRLLLEEPLVQAAGVPSFGRVTVTRKGTTRLVHVLTYVPELRGRAEVIEEPVTVRDVAIALRLDGSRVKGVSLAPGGAPLDYAVDGGYVRFTVPEVEGYALAVVEAE